MAVPTPESSLIEAPAGAPATEVAPAPGLSIPAPAGPLPLPERIHVHNQVVHRIRAFLAERGYVEIPVPELTPATGSCEVVDSMFTLDYFGGLAFPRQTGQLYLEELVAGGMDAVYCEGESLRREQKVDRRHLTEFKLIEIEKRDMSLAELCDLQEALVKDVARVVSPDLLGAANMRRLEQVVRAEHPRLTYREAVAVLQKRGFALAFGDDLERDHEAELNRYAGDLPVHVTHYPESLKFFNMKLDRRDPLVVECVDYVLPLSGESFGGSLREPDHDILARRLYEGTMYGHLMNRARDFARQRTLAATGGEDPAEVEKLAARYQGGIEQSFLNYLGLFRGETVERAGFGLGVARLLQFLMGLDSVKDAVVFPMDRTRFGGLSQTTMVES